MRLSLIAIPFIFFTLCLLEQTKAQNAPLRRDVDVVFALDLSGSTNGLVDNLRDKMWDIINQWKMFEPKPKLRIGVVGFSRLSFTGGSGYVKILCDLTDDYDVVSNSLFNLPRSVENGYQFIGAAINVSVTGMEWSTNASAIKLIYLIGNGKVNIGTVNFRESCELAKEQNIVINTIYCNKLIRDNRNIDITGWVEIASSTGGQQYDTYVNKRAPLISIKSDLLTLRALKDSLNDTYLPYGKAGADKLKFMKEADDNASKVYEAYLYSRLKYKFSDEYQRRQFIWDIVAYKSANPETKLSAFKAAATNSVNNTSDSISLEDYVVNKLEKRNRITSILKSHFPIGEENRIQSEIAMPDYDLGSMLDRILIVSFYQFVTTNGFKPSPEN